MRKTYRMILAAVLFALSAMTVNAGEIVSLQEIPFNSWDGWGADAQSTGTASCAWTLGEPTDCPYGDSGVINYADLSNCVRLIVTVADGAPRFLLNRDVNEGQWNADESQSHLIDNTQGGWSSKYFTQEGNVYYVDLKAIAKDKGFCHLHAIKGANWANVTIESLEVELIGKGRQIGWINLINNSDMEGDDVSSFFTKTAKGDPSPSEITDGVGVNGGRGIVVAATAKESDAWDNQFWFRFNEVVAADAKYRLSFDYRADTPATVSTQAHAEPSDYIWYEMLGNIDFTTEWQTFSVEGTVTADQAGPNGTGGLFTSVAFNLNELADANNYYFDNIKFEVYKAGTAAEFDLDVIQIDFGFDTNIPALVAATGKPRLLFPNDCVTVTAGGKPQGIMSVEAYADGRFYIFLEDDASGKGEVRVTLKNPADKAYHLVYEGGPGGDVPDFDDVAEENPDIQLDDVYPYLFATPSLVEADPEDGSFNLPNSIKEFKVTFDKPVDCAAIVATLGKEKLTVSPANGFAEAITLTRTGSDNLTTGAYVLKIDKIYGEERLSDEIFGTLSFTVNVGKVEIDPTDVAKDIVSADLFANTDQGGVPEGYLVKFQEEDRIAPNTYGSGPRLFDFAAGGDFTKGLYFREGYVQYGNVEGYPLTLEAGKKYNIHFTTAMWKANGSKTRFQIMNEYEDVLLTQMIDNAPDVNGSQAAVNGATNTDVTYIPETSGNYILRWTTASSEDAEPGYSEVLIANVSVRYIPNVAGVEETQLIETALENAKSVREGNQGDRYAGPAYTALEAAIAKYEAEVSTYTAPSKYTAAAAALDEAAKAVKDHRTLCDTYDPLPVQAQEIVDNNAEGKFAQTALYSELKSVAAKYIVKGTETVVDEETGNEYTIDVNEAKMLTDDTELQAAIDELKQIVAAGQDMFTEGESSVGDAGIKVLVERIRQGAAALKDLGVADDDELIVAANNAITDDDALVEQLKNRLKLELFKKMKEPGNDMFAPTIDENTMEEIAPRYNMTVFVKNPNIYALQAHEGFSEENVPGWTAPIGSPDVNTIWTHDLRYTEGLPEDVAFTKWHSLCRMEQTVTDLPAGVYTIVIDAVSWADDDTTDGYVYVKTTDTPAVEEGMEEDRDLNFYATYDLAYYGQYVGHNDNELEVEVYDGLLTFGANFGPNSQYEFDKVSLYLTGAVAGYDYAKAYEQILTGVEPAAKTAKVRAIELYDLNGKRIPVAKKGVVIVKKYMSDGSVRTEKIVK